MWSLILFPEELFAELVAGDHDGTCWGHLQQSRRETWEESPPPLIRHQLLGDCDVAPGSTCRQ